MSSRQAERRRRLRREKRGVVLLVVVSILTLFLMIGVTYVLVASNYQKSSAQNLQSQRYGDEAEREAEEIIGQILYGNLQLPGNSGPRSVIAPHSLLGDLYGNEVVVGTIDNYPPNTPNPPPPNTLNAGQCFYFHANIPAQPIPNYYAGRVITFTDGPAAGLSTRVMEYSPAGRFGPGPELLVEMPESDLPIPVLPSEDSRFVINGSPFNGTGAGFVNRTAGADMMLGTADDVDVQNLEETVQLNYTGTPHNYLQAFLPNFPFYPPGSADPRIGGLDESWDAPDYQNPFLAMVPPLKMAQNDIYPLLPSYHRPDLVQFWIQSLQQAGPPPGLLNGVNDPTGQLQRDYFVYPYGQDGIRDGAPGDNAAGNPDRMQFTLQQADELVALKRMIVFRPLREDHPNFTGSNQNFREDALAGPYDVDNDGDGISDSIWVDAGLPVVTAPNGRRYKRLVAILIKDLDGRVNPNAHGNLAQVDAFFQPNANPNRASTTIRDVLLNYPPTIPAAPQGNQVTLAGIDFNNANAGNFYLSRGLGFGPAEVDFRHIFLNDDAVYNNVLLQRYFTTSSQESRPGISDPTSQTNPLNDDGWSRLRTIGMPADHTTQFSMYSTPPDVWGRAAMAVDYTGQPLWTLAGTFERLDDPYEIQWDQLRASADAPYTVSELEALLRYHDLGAAIIPSRLMQLAGGYLAMESRGTPGPSQVRREAFGIGSYIPAPKLVVPRELRAGLGAGVASSPTLLDFYYGAVSGDTTQFRNIVPFEFLKGQLFNLNRELGNGLDDNGNGVVDDPGEFPNEAILTTAPTPPPIALNYFNDSPPNAGDQRQLYARHLYCLAMLLRNKTAPDTIDLDGDPATPPTPEETARYYAQWAINVVDFRDPDSIMSPFEYDSTPLNGWGVDGNLLTTGDRQLGDGVVWGCERPELLITENISGHDRRTTDTDRDPSNQRVAMGDDYDSELRPEGWAFIELYNPWFDRSNSQYDHKPAELYGNGGVQLDRLTPAANGPRYPVWRVLVVRGSSINTNPENTRAEELTLGVNGNPPPQTPAGSGRWDVERSIYFTNPIAAGVNRPAAAGYTDGEAYFPSTIPQPVAPGRYAVIGSSGRYDATAGTYTTYIGRRTDAPTSDTIPDFYDPTLLNLGTTRRIELNPAAGTLIVSDNQNNAAADPPATTDIMPVVALPVDMAIRGGVAVPQSFNVTEPTEAEGLYPALATFPPSPTDEGHYSPAIDEPLDYARSTAPGGAEWQFLTDDQTVPNHRAIHLQRLANPLLPWNGVTNPYLTIDSSNMDATAYNGVTVDDDDVQKTDGTVNLQTFQRGGRFTAADVPGYPPDTNRVFRDLWKREPVPTGLPTVDSPPETATGPHHLPQNLWHTLGYLNKRYHPYFGAAGGIYRGAPYYLDAAMVPAPAAPFPWLAFHNRPFNNTMELLQVPCWQSSRLLEQFSVQYFDPMLPQPQPWTSMYQPQMPPVNPNATYGHLLNFFHTTATPLNPNSTDGLEISRLLDYVETRTPYTQTEKNYKPDAPGNFATDPNSPAGYRPPFNYLSRFREPGRININTIYDSNVWDAAVRGFPGMCGQAPEGDGGTFLLNHLVVSRQGNGMAALQVNALFPSLFSQPFRTADSADMMPPLQAPATLRQSPANGGLLRRDANPYPGISDVDRPLFASDDITPRQDAARNPYFRYQGLQKIGSLFSTNSNVYAVWLTVGYFEVEQNPPSNTAPGGVDLAHPDGLRLAGEVGAETGEVKRHRMFYIIDRSAPVGYEPGRRHNTDKAVLLKRFIE